MKRALSFLAILLIAGGCAYAAESGNSADWPKAALDAMSVMPVLSEGRVKPLDTYASFAMLKINGRRKLTNLEGKPLSGMSLMMERMFGEKRKPTPWLMDMLFRPEVAASYPVFRLEDSDVIVAVGGTPHASKRDNYSYKELSAIRDRLYELADQYASKDSKELETMQRQILRLAENVHGYEVLAQYAEFARMKFQAPGLALFAKLFPGSDGVSFSALLEQSPALQAGFMELRATLKDKPDDAATKEQLAAFRGLLDQMDFVRQSGTDLALFPAGEKGEWWTPGDYVTRAFEAETLSPAYTEALALLRAFEAMTAVARDGDAFAKAAAEFLRLSKARALPRGEYENIPLEVTFYQVGFFSKAMIFFIISFLLIALSWAAPNTRWLGRLTFLFPLIPTTLLIAGITMRCLIRHRPPVTTLYETILFVVAVVMVAAFMIELITRQRIILSAALALAVGGMFLANKYEAIEGRDTMPSMVAVLDTNFWLAAHVTTIAVGYAACLLAAAVGHIYVLGKALGLRRNDSEFYANLARVTYGVVCFALLFTFLGTTLGGVWANESWGRFWGWDPKENSALLIVLWLMIILHARLGGHIREMGICMAAVFGAVLVTFSWWGVNLLGVGLHSYGFTSGTMTALAVFWGIEGLVLTAGGARWLIERR
jgi:ABC-type transport system involved in cytochrome c biogenesis permease subunit